MLDLHAYVTAEKRGNALALLGSGRRAPRHGVAKLHRRNGARHGRVDAGAAEEILEALESLGVPPDDIGLARRSWIQPAGATVTTGSALMWAGVLGVARSESRVVGRYLGLMLVAGIIAGYGVIIDNPILIVGAMAVSPDLVPLIAASVGTWGR